MCRHESFHLTTYNTYRIVHKAHRELTSVGAYSEENLLFVKYSNKLWNN